LSAQSPAAALISKVNREQAKLVKCYDELNKIAMYIRDSDVSGEVKLRLFAALKEEYELLQNERTRILSMKKAAEVSRGPQWVTHSDS
jgi:hypothetical protein